MCDYVACRAIYCRNGRRMAAQRRWGAVDWHSCSTEWAADVRLCGMSRCLLPQRKTKGWRSAAGVLLVGTVAALKWAVDVRLCGMSRCLLPQRTTTGWRSAAGCSAP